MGEQGAQKPRKARVVSFPQIEYQVGGGVRPISVTTDGLEMKAPDPSRVRRVLLVEDDDVLRRNYELLLSCGCRPSQESDELPPPHSITSSRSRGLSYSSPNRRDEDVSIITFTGITLALLVYAQGW